MTRISLINDLSLTIQGVLKYHSFLKQSQYWSKKKMEEYQFNKLKKLLFIAEKESPYYTDLFKQINFNPRTDFNSIDDLKKIPILTKKEAKANQDKLVNKSLINKSITLRTSGSTGVPFEIQVSYNAWVIEQAVVWRHWAWGGYKFRDSMAIVRSFAPKENESLIKHDKIKNFTYYSPFHLNDNYIGEFLADMCHRKIRILRGYPSSIVTIANYIKRFSPEIPKLKLILTASEVLTDGERKFIEEVFGTKISNHYGLADVCVMMGDCEKHEGLHNYDEYGYLELLDTKDVNQKRIVGTHLHNYAMPLIRYETGDIAELSENPCSCNRALPSIKNIIGRKDNSILTQEGYVIPTVNFYTMFEKYHQINQWQIVQNSLENIDFIINVDVLENSFLDLLLVDIKTRIPSSMTVNIKVNEPFIKVNEGKQNPFISKIRL